MFIPRRGTVSSWRPKKWVRFPFFRRAQPKLAVHSSVFSWAVFHVCLANTVSSLEKRFSLLKRNTEIPRVPWSNSAKTRVLPLSFPLGSTSRWLLKMNSSPKLQDLSNFHLPFNWKWSRLEGRVTVTISIMRAKFSHNNRLWCFGQRHLNNEGVNGGCQAIAVVRNTLYVAEMLNRRMTSNSKEVEFERIAQITDQIIFTTFVLPQFYQLFSLKCLKINQVGLIFPESKHIRGSLTILLCAKEISWGLHNCIYLAQKQRWRTYLAKQTVMAALLCLFTPSWSTYHRRCAFPFPFHFFLHISE